MYQCNNRTSGETDVLETEPDIKQHENTCNDQCLDRIGTHLITYGCTDGFCRDLLCIHIEILNHGILELFTFCHIQGTGLEDDLGCSVNLLGLNITVAGNVFN